MRRSSILSDELLRQLMAVGQVDILVGVPTYNHAATIQSVIRTLHVGLARHFPRERTVIVNADGGSDDGTVDLVRTAPMADEEMRGSTSLRTTHRVSATHSGAPGRAAGERMVFAAADLLQARAVVLVDPDLTSLTPEWVAELARPVWTDQADFVLAVHPRGRFEAPLLSQLVRPLLSAAYGQRLYSNVTGDYACAGRFAARLVQDEIWEREPMRPALDIWVVATALAEHLRLHETRLGPRVLASRALRVGLPELFEQVVGTTFASLEQHAGAWLGRAEAREAAALDALEVTSTDAVPIDTAPLEERFRSGVRDLAPLLGEILSPGTLARSIAAAAPGGASIMVSDGLWVNTVYEFAAAAHHRVMSREHLTQALVPLYLGRTASFFTEIASADEPAYLERQHALDREFERLRPYLVERWNAEGGR